MFVGRRYVKETGLHTHIQFFVLRITTNASPNDSSYQQDNKYYIRITNVQFHRYECEKCLDKFYKMDNGLPQAPEGICTHPLLAWNSYITLRLEEAVEVI